jgi:hypothetical protein
MTAFDIGTTWPLATGMEVEVLTRFEPHWTTGFAIAAVEDDRIHLRRHSDGTILPASFGAHEVRPRRQDRGATSSSDTTSIPAARNASAVTPDPGRNRRENVPS